MNDKLYGVFGLAIGFLIAFILFGQVPDVKTVIETRVITKQVQVVKNTVTERVITKYKDGTEVIKEKIVDRDVIKEKETIKEKIIDKTVTYSGEICVLWNPFEFKVYPDIIHGQYTLMNPLFIGAEYSITAGKMYLGVGIKF